MVRRVKFDANDKVQEIEIFNDTHSNDLRIVKEYTKSLGNDQNPLQQFVKNFGRFNKPKQTKKNRHGAKP